MSSSARLRLTAINLMQMALRLQHAISIATREPPMREGDVLDDETVAPPGMGPSRS